ncbi:MAG: DUF1622 domain-containing protein [Bacillota bacterium]|nr:DUF1622 domain-containing protein [Bacillota bacterium]
MDMWNFPYNLLHNFSIIIAMMAVSVLVWGTFITFSKWLYHELKRKKSTILHKKREELRIKLGSYILIGLEILIVADIIETIINPTIMEVALLGAIVLIRTFISYFLEKELEAHEKDIME